MAELSGQYLTNLPATQAQTAPSIQLYVVDPGNLNTGLSYWTTSQKNRKLIGAVTGYTRSMTRNTIRRTELDSEVPGRAFEIIPLAITNFSLTLKTVMLSRQLLSDVLGFNNQKLLGFNVGNGSVEDLSLMNRPLLLEEHRYSRYWESNKWVYKKRAIRYNGCILKSYPISMDINGEWMVMQDCEFDVAYSEVSEEENINPQYIVPSGNAYSSGF
jgi:hypothetical protein